MAAPATNPRFEAMLELERRGTLPPAFQQQLDTARQQGVVKAPKAIGVEQGKAASFYSRAVGAMRDFDKTGEGARSLPRQAFSEKFPGLENSFLNTDGRQMADAAMQDFIAATLRYESGAALPPSEFTTQSRIFFPQPGDGAPVIEQKRLARQRAIDGLRLSAGPAADIADKQIAERAAEQAPATGPVLNAAEAASTVITGAIDKAAGVEPPPPPDGYDQSRGVLRVTVPNPNAKPKAPVLPEGRGKGDFIESIDAAINGATDTLSLGFRDELEAGGKTLFDGGTMADNLKAERAVDRYDEQNNAGARIAGQVLGGFALPMGTSRGAVALGGRGAAYGAGYGFGSADGPIGERVAGAATGAALGGATGAALGAAGSRMAALGNGRAGGGVGNAEGRATLEAADRLGALTGVKVQPTSADLGGPIVRKVTGALGQGAFSVGPIVKAGQRLTGQAQEAADAIASKAGNVMEPAAAGESAREGVIDYIKRTGVQKNRLYKRAEEGAAGIQIDLADARRVLDDHIVRASEAVGGDPLLPRLKELRTELYRPATVQGIRDMRTILRKKFLTGEFLAGNDERIINDVVSAAGTDVQRGLVAAGKTEAASAYRAADAYNRERAEMIESVLQPIIGKRTSPKSGEEIVRAINAAAKGNQARVGRFMSALPDDEAATVRASAINQLGRAANGNQNAAGDAFSLATFLSNWNSIKSGREALFGADTVSALNDLAKVAEGTKAAQRYANHSNTGGSISALAGLMSGGSTLIAEYGGARLLASPSFARWLARAPAAANPGGYTKRLAAIAAREPAIANELAGLQSRLSQAIKSPQPVAAEEPNDVRQPKP